MATGSVRWTRLAAAGMAGMACSALGQQCGTSCVSPVGSPASGVWTAENSPYCISGDVVVGTLVVEAGVCVLIDGPYKIDVVNRITVMGTRENPVVFTPKSPGTPWKGIGFQNANPGSRFEWCIIEGSDNSGVRIVNTSAAASVPEFDHCTIRGNTGPVHAGGMRVSLAGQQLVMKDCTISGNVANPGLFAGTHVGGGMYLTGSAALTRCTFRGNECYGIGNCGGGAAALGGGLYVDGAGVVDLRGCSFELNRAYGAGPGCFGGCVGAGNGGAAYLAGGTLNLINSVVASNTVGGCGGYVGGVWVQGGTANIRNSTIVANTSEGLHVQGGEVDVRNSILYYNNAGAAQLAGPATINFSDVQNGQVGGGNIDVSPNLIGGETPTTACQAAFIERFSLCVDAGDPGAAFEDAASPPGLGGRRNDMGAYGGEGNAVLWPPDCYVNLDCSTIAPALNVNDFVRFIGLYSMGDPRANCDGSTAQPVLNVNDFICFQQRYAAGCG